MRAYKFRIYPTGKQMAELNKHLWLSKNLWNELLAHNKRMYQDYGYFAAKNTMQRMAKGYGLFSQTQEVLTHRLHNAVVRYLKLKKQGKKCGFPRFKPIDRMRSLNYPQFGFKLGVKLKVNPFGEITVKKHREIEGRIKTLTLKKEPTGKWFATFCVEQEKKTPKTNNGGQIGIDLGLTTFATFSDGQKIANPRHIKLYEDKLAFLQKRLSRKAKRSKNKTKSRLKVAKLHEKVADCRKDSLHKLSRNLVDTYSMVAFEKLQSQDMAEHNYGKQINDAGWGMFANMVSYKAEDAGCEVVFVNPMNTTKMCSNCGALTTKTLWDRIHKCSCGLEMDRDFNAAKNILALARSKIGQELPESTPVGDETIVSSMKQEALT